VGRSKALIDADWWLHWFVPWLGTTGTIQLSHSFLVDLPWFLNEIVLYLDEFSSFQSQGWPDRTASVMRIGGSIGCFCWFATAGRIQLSHSILAIHRAF